MLTIESLTTFLGWCTVVNMGLLAVVGISLLVMRDWAAGIHAKMFSLSEDAVRIEYFRYLANFKILVFVLNLAPYVALKLMA